VGGGHCNHWCPAYSGTWGGRERGGNAVVRNGGRMENHGHMIYIWYDLGFLVLFSCFGQTCLVYNCQAIFFGVCPRFRDSDVRSPKDPTVADFSGRFLLLQYVQFRMNWFFSSQIFEIFPAQDTSITGQVSSKSLGWKKSIHAGELMGVDQHEFVGFISWTFDINVNPGLINHGLLIKGVFPPNSHDLILFLWYLPN
jgi:hypothetical protein